MLMTEYTVRVKKYEPTDRRLGRNVNHDSRSLFFLAPESEPATLVSKRHYSNVPVLDQGNLGSCTGNAATKNLSYPLFWDTGQTVLSQSNTDANEQYAVGVYSAATVIDSYSGTYLPEDTGSDGLSVAKVLKGRGLISGYTHATSMNAVLTALQTQAVIVGTEWRADMFDTDTDGRIFTTGRVEGGHEYVLDEIDVENKRVWMQNSWGTGWGIKGRGYFTWDDFAELLAADGDCTVFSPITAPAPTPDPGPAPKPPETADAQFASAAHKWLDGFPFFYRGFQKSLKQWLNAKNL